MKKLLPIKQPPIISYQQLALPLTVAMMNTTAKNWFYSNYIQASCVSRNHYISKKNFDCALHYGFYNPEITSPESADHLCMEGCEQLYLFKNLKFIREVIDAGWYIYTDADMFYIDGSDVYNIYHYTHDLMIYGYDDENVYIYMYDETKLVSHTVSYDNFFSGYYSEYCNEKFYRNRAILFKPNNKECIVNINKIRWHMHDYLNGVETFARERPNIFNPDSLTMHGINTYAEFDKLFDYVMECEQKYLMRTDIYCLYEHKKVMFERVIYLKEHNILSASASLVDEFTEIQKMTQIFMMLGLKLNILKDEKQQCDIILKLKRYIANIKEKEEAAWNRYIAENKEVLG